MTDHRFAYDEAVEQSRTLRQQKDLTGSQMSQMVETLVEAGKYVEAGNQRYHLEEMIAWWTLLLNRLAGIPTEEPQLAEFSEPREYIEVMQRSDELRDRVYGDTDAKPSEQEMRGLLADLAAAGAIVDDPGMRHKLRKEINWFTDYIQQQKGWLHIPEGADGRQPRYTELPDLAPYQDES